MSSSVSLNETEADKHKRFENEGVVFKAKLIGSELVMEPRGDKMCQNSIQRLKAIIKGTNSHKKRIVLKISFDGVKVYDEKTNEMLYEHEVSQISYIASDDTDNRTFGYVSDVPNKAHQFICFKTSGPAINVMSVISALFEAVLEKKNKAEKEKEQQQVPSSTSSKQNKQPEAQIQQDSIDLIGDSGIMDGDASIMSSNDDVNHWGVRPIPRRQNSQHSVLLPPSSLPRPAPMMASARPSHNRSLVYNHSSVSLSDATSIKPQNSGNNDRYAVFNDIDNFPSIFESLGSANNVNETKKANSSSDANMFRQTNPFDDDFFA